MTADIGDGKQVVVGCGHLKIFANRGWLGVQLTPDEMEAIGLALWTRGRRMKREQQCRSGAGS